MTQCHASLRVMRHCASLFLYNFPRNSFHEGGSSKTATHSDARREKAVNR